MALDKDSGLGSAPGGAGASTFDELTDTPSSKTGQANRLVTVNNLETALEYTDPPAGVSINFLGGYIFDGASVGDSDPGAGRFRLNNVDHTLATFAFVSNTQEGGPDFSATLVDLATGDLLSAMQRDTVGRADAFILSGPAIAASEYFKLPVTHTSVGGIGGIVDATSCVLWLNSRGQINANTQSIDRIAITEVVTPSNVTLDAASGAGLTFSYPSGDAIFIGEDSLRTSITYPAGVNVEISGGLVDDLVILTINIAGGLEQFDTQLSPSIRRTTAQLGAIVRNAAGALTFAFDPGQIEFQVLNKITDLANAIGPFASRAIRVSTSGIADTSFRLFGGRAFSYDSSQNILDPSSVPVPDQTIANFEVYLSDGEIEGTKYVGDNTNTLLQPDQYQPAPLLPVAAPLATIPGGPNQATITLFFWQAGAAVPSIRVLPGQVIYASMSDAINGLETYAPTIPSRVSATAIPLGGVICIKGADDFTSTTEAMFFRSTAINGGGAGTVAPNMGEVYANTATQPQYLINNVQNQIQVQDGIDDPDTVLYEFLNFLGVAQWRATSTGLTITGGTEPNLTGVQDIDADPSTEPDNKTVRIPAGFGYITDFRTDTETGTRMLVTWPLTLFTIPDGTLNTDDATYIFHNGTDFDSQNTAPTNRQGLENIFIATTINETDTTTIAITMPAYRLTGTTSQILVEYLAFKGVEGTGGVVSKTTNPGANGGLALRISALTLFAPWSNAGNDRNNMSGVSYLAQDPLIFAYMLRDGDYAGGSTQITPALYDDGSGSAVAVPNPARNTTIQYVWQLITGQHIITFGQFIYDGLSSGVAALSADRANRILPQVLKRGVALELAALVVQKDCVDIDNTSTIRIVALSGGAAGTATPESFISLTDTPAEYVSQARKLVQVLADESGLEFVDPTVVTASVAPDGTLDLVHNLDTDAVKVSATYLDSLGVERAVGEYPPYVRQRSGFTDFGVAGSLAENVQCTPVAVSSNAGYVWRRGSTGVYLFRSVNAGGVVSNATTISVASTILSCDLAAVSTGAICVFINSAGQGAAAITDGAQTVTTTEFVWRAASTDDVRCHELSDGNIVIVYSTATASVIEAQVMDVTGALVGASFTVTVNGNGTHYAVGCADGNIVFLYGDLVTGELAYRVQSNDLTTQIVSETIIVGASIDYAQIQGVSRLSHARFLYQDRTNGDVRYTVEINTAGEVIVFNVVDEQNSGTVSTVNDIGLTVFDDEQFAHAWLGANGWLNFKARDSDQAIALTQVCDQPRICALPGQRRFVVTGSFADISAGRYQAAVYEIEALQVFKVDSNTARIVNTTRETLTITLSVSRY